MGRFVFVVHAPTGSPVEQWHMEHRTNLMLTLGPMQRFSPSLAPARNAQRLHTDGDGVLVFSTRDALVI